MTNKTTLSLALFAGILAAILAVALWPKNSTVDYIAPNDKFTLTSAELEQLSAKAEKGDAPAAIRLANYYDFVVGNSMMANKWWKIAATQGDIIAQYTVGIALLEGGDPIQGRKWLELAAKNGSEDAKRRLLIEGEK